MSNNNFLSVRSSRYEPANGWQESVLVGAADGFAFNPDITMNAGGKTIAVFSRQDDASGFYDIVAYELIAGSWQGPTTLDDVANVNIADKPQIAMNDAGDVAVVWQQNFGPLLQRPSIYLNRFDAGAGQWSGAMLVETQDDFNADEPDVAIDAAGNIFVIWRQNTVGTIRDLMVRRYEPGNTVDPWSPVEILEAEASNAGSNVAIISQQIVADDEGNAIAAWIQNDVNANENLRTARYSIADGWQPAELLETNDTRVYGPHLVMDRASGNAMVVWGRSNHILANRYTKPPN